MLNLKGQQIQALAGQIAKELNDNISKYNEDLKAKTLSDFFKTKNGKMILALREDYPKAGIFTDQYIFSYLLPQVQVKSRINPSDVGNDIIIKTIDSDNLDELIKSIKEKYTK